MTDLHAHWAKLESGLTALVESLPALSPDGRAGVLHYVDHNEFQLALETLCGHLEQECLRITSVQHEKIVGLQSMMKLSGVAEAVEGLVDR